MKLESSRHIFEKHSNTKLLNIRQVTTHLFLADRRTGGRTWRRITFRNFAKEPKNCVLKERYSVLCVYLFIYYLFFIYIIYLLFIYYLFFIYIIYLLFIYLFIIYLFCTKLKPFNKGFVLYLPAHYLQAQNILLRALQRCDSSSP